MTAQYDKAHDKAEDDLRARAVARLEQKQSFLRHFAWYLVINAFVWGLWAFTEEQKSGFPWPGWVTLGWGIPVALHAFQLFGRMGDGDITEDKIQREMRKMG